MRWLSDLSELRDERAKLATLLKLDQWLPDQVFRFPPARCFVLEFDRLLSHELIGAARRVSHQLDGGAITLGTLSPDPEEYFFKHFSRIPWLEIDPESPAEHVTAALMEDPGDSPADALLFRADRVIVYGDPIRWLYLGDRELEIGILGCLDTQVAEAWTSEAGGMIRTVEEALQRLLPAISREGVLQDLADALRRNYGGLDAES